jgi:hypothetical protein
MMMGIGIPINQRRIPRPIKSDLSFYWYFVAKDFKNSPSGL